MGNRIITTEDGSHSLFNEELNETYHSTRGAKGESLHVFIEEGFNYWVNQHNKQELSILEIGLGTGLNALLTGMMAEEKKIHVRYVSLEPFPVDETIYRNLNYGTTSTEQNLLDSIHTCFWNKDTLFSDFYNFSKRRDKLEDYQSENTFDLIYFDAFAPSKQPGVWSVENLQKCFDLLNPAGILTTYCAQGQFKRNLESVGFHVETLPGAMGKKEMVRAAKP